MSVQDDTFDAEADAIIGRCLDLNAPQSFFLYAGAGSGKTRSLVDAIKTASGTQARKFSLSGQKIGVITYTNAACDEIKQRLAFDPRVDVSTIHAFSWSLIAGYDTDIRQWLSGRLLRDIAELEAAQAKGRASQASLDRAASIDSKRRRHATLHEVQQFIYSPTGDNRTRDALNHAEVIAMTIDLLRQKPALQLLLVTRYPILLIDESQDTVSGLMDALLEIEEANNATFCLGLLGDTMQRIYADGKVRLADAIPARWAKPRKRMNHRCPTRVMTLLNQIRRGEDGETQQARSDAPAGFVRLFLVPEGTQDKGGVETSIAERMRLITGDALWDAGASAIKTLALEHMMSARRFGFVDFFEPLYAVQRIRTSLLQGTSAAIGFFTREIVPLVAALRAHDPFAVAAHVRRHSPLLSRTALEEAGDGQATILATTKAVCDGLLRLVDNPHSASARDVLVYSAETGLFSIPDALVPFATREAAEGDGGAVSAEDDDPKSELSAWRAALDAPFEQLEKYYCYVRGQSQFDTHQGVKGREFPRVMVILSDEESKGFLFAYDKLLGAKQKSKADLENEAAGKETTIDRTRRLFYVTCSRAEESLAIVYYTADVAAAHAAILALGWFEPDEIEVVG